MASIPLGDLTPRAVLAVAAPPPAAAERRGERALLRRARRSARGDGALMARSLGMIFVAGPLTGVAWVLLAGHPPSTSEAIIWGAIACALGVGVTLLSGRLDAAGPRAFGLLVLVANLLVTLAVVASATPLSGYPFFYLWATPYAYVFFSPRVAALHTMFAGGALAVALATMPEVEHVSGVTLVTFVLTAAASITVVGLLARGLTRALQHSDMRFVRGFHSTALGAAMTSADLHLAEVNDSLAKLLGRQRERLLGRSLADLMPREDASAVAKHARDAEAGSDPVSFECRFLCPAGEIKWARINMTRLPERESGRAALFMVVEDVTERKRAEREAAQLMRENELILRSAGDGIFRIDRDGIIRYANPAAAELLGWRLDEMLGARSHELLHHSRPDGTPYPLDACPIFASASGEGVHRSTDEVFWRADGTSFPVDYTSAPIRENGEPAGAVCVFADISETRRREAALREELEVRERITRAIAEGDLVALSQPIVELASGEQVGEELLVRLRDRRDGGLIRPAEFLPQAERSGLIPQIDREMLRKGAALAREGRNVAVNLAADSVIDPETLRELERSIRGPSLRGGLTLEITETAAMENMDAARRFAERAAGLGCSIALDDFGTGFGAFTYLRSLPVDYLKVDIEFVRELETSPSDERIVRTIVGIARDLGLRTIAEGVEAESTRRALLDLGVDYAQGYLFGRPEPINRPD